MRQERLAAFEEFAQANGGSLVRLSFALCGDRGAAEDAAQEALTGVYLRWGRQRPRGHERASTTPQVVTSTVVGMPAHSAASSSPGSVQLTSYQTTVLAKAHVTEANLAVLKKMHLTSLQIKALGVASGRHSRSPEREAAISS